MFVEPGKSGGDPADQERRDSQQEARRVLGHVIKCDGARATLAATVMAEDGEATGEWTVGRMISINLGTTRTVGLVFEIEKTSPGWSMEGENPIVVKVELVGEVRDSMTPGGKPTFERGITKYPHIGAISHRIRSQDLQAVYDLAGRQSVNVGKLAQDESIDANIAIEDTLTRHFAFVGTTGVGKSTAVSLVVRRAIEARPELRVLIFDPHNEFAHSFGSVAHRIDTTKLDLPFWMFRLEEFAEVLFRGRDVDPDEVEVLRDIIPVAKQLYRGAGASVVRRASEIVTADTPVPYRMADLLKELDARIGMLDAKSERPTLRSLKARIDAAILDPLYRFMFNSKLIEDTIHETIANIFRVPHDGRRVTCFEMAGLPSEIVNSVCSVLSRLAFDLAVWSDGRLKVLVLCEEAHRYMPADSKLGFAPTRHALSRIAKEGRKYGCYLGVITQRPGELDQTILSQCSTVFAMRLANEQDQAIIRSAIADSSASSLSFLSSIGQREAIAFGEGVATTMRLKFTKLAQDMIPCHVETAAPASDQGDVDLASIVRRLRNVREPTPVEELPVPPPALQQREIESELRRRPISAEDQGNTGYGPRPTAFGFRRT